MMKINIDKEKIEEILTRSVAEILPTKDSFYEALTSGRRLRIYIGTDPTGTSLHLGHATNYIILEKLRRLGHEVIFLVGDFTARIGDPTDKLAARKPLTRKQVLENAKDYKKQIGKVLDLEKSNVRFLYNEEWTNKLKPVDLLEIASYFTVARLLERDMFQKRMKEGKHIFLHEFFYPLMQGYDSVAMEVDVELCGTDQIFNALMGRTLLRKIKNKEKFVVAVNLMENPKTGELMSKSRGTGVFLNTTPTEMFGAVMAQPDEMIRVLLVNFTRVSVEKIEELLKSGPLEAKKKTATEIIKIIFNEKKAKEAEENFVKTFQKKEIPDDMEEVRSSTGELLSEILVKNKVLSSKGEWRRLVLENAVHDLLKNQNITDVNLKLGENLTLRIGKKRFIKILIN